MKLNWLRASLTAILVALVLSCGGGRKAPTVSDTFSRVGGADQRRQTTLSETLAELDALEAPEAVDESVFSALKSALHEALTATWIADVSSATTGGTPVIQGEEKKLVSKPPTGPSNRIEDLTHIDNGDGTYTLTWSYRNVGDYNQDGIVDVADITPLVVHFNEPADEMNEWIDGNADFVINIMDITPLAANLLSDVAGYAVAGADSPEDEFANFDFVLLSPPQEDAVLRFATAPSESDFKYLAVRSFGAGGLMGQLSNIVVRSFGPVAIADANVTAGKAPLTVTFACSDSYDRDGSIVKYEWDFDGDGVSDWESPAPLDSQYTYDAEGDYEATLRVTDDEGGVGADSILITVGDNGPPVAVAEAWPTKGNEPLTVLLIPSDSFDPDGEIVSYAWDFYSNGTYDWLGDWPQPVEHTYEHFGTYRAKLRVTDDMGATDRDTVTVRVNGIPTARLSADPVQGFNPLPVSFDASASSDPDGTIVKYEWDWDGDGVLDQDTGSEPTARHTYESAGAYVATAYVTDDDGARSTASVVVSIAQTRRGDWWMFGREPTHNRRSPYVGAQTARLKWRYETGGMVASSPAIGADGTIYVGSYDDYLYAINPDGTLKWRYETGGDVFSSPAIGDDGTIYVGSHDYFLYALSPDGTLKWRYETRADVNSSPAIGTDGTIYVGSWDRYLYAINPDGTLKWRYETGGNVGSSPAIGADGTIYVGSVGRYSNSCLYAINPDGTLKWRYELWYFLSSPAIGPDGTIYVGSDHADYGYLYAINLDGTLKWRYLTEGGGCNGPAIGADGTIYAGSDYGGYLYAISPDGSLKWRYDTGGRVYSSPAIGADGTIYAGSRDRYLYAINPDGTLKWRYITWGDVRSSPAIGADGTIYVGSCDYSLYAFHISGVNQPPVARLSAHPPLGEPPLTVDFDGSYSYDPDGSIVSYDYDWDGDGNYDLLDGGPTPTHTYYERGKYNATVRVRDNDGASGTASATVTVSLPWHVVTVDSDGDVGEYTSLAVVNGNPAIGYYDETNGDLKYVRASDASGSSWGTPVTPDSAGDVGKYTSLKVVNGNPAISYYDWTNDDLKYVRASDAKGSSWEIPVTVDWAGNVGWGNSLAVVDSNPAISYYDYTNKDLKYVRASDANGTSWGTPVTVDSAGDVGSYNSLAVVNGNPAIGYYDETNGDLKYVRASDASGSSWGTQLIIDSAGTVGTYTSLAVVNGNPAISYGRQDGRGLKYVRASNADGSSWRIPVVVDGLRGVGSCTSLAVVNVFPAISYYHSSGYGNLMYVRAGDAYGDSWGTLVTVNSAGDVGEYNSLAVVNGNPAISYYDATNRDLKFAIREY